MLRTVAKHVLARLPTLWRGLALVSCFVVALLASVAVHIGVPAVRSSISTVANAALADVLYGQIRIGKLQSLSWNSLRVERAELLDPEGRRVIFIEGVQINTALPRLVYDVLAGGPHLNVVVPHVRIERGRVGLYETSDSQTLTIETAVTPRPSKKKPSTAPSVSRHVRVHLPRFEVGVVRGDFGLPGWEEIKPALFRVRGGVLFSPQGIVLDIERFAARSRDVFGRRVRGTGSFALRSPGPLRLDFAGFADDAEVQANLGYEGDQLTLTAILPRVHPATLRRWFGTWPGQTDAGVQLTASGVLPHLNANATISLADGTLEARGPIDLSEGVRGQLDVSATQVQLRDVVAEAPHALLNADGQLDLTVAGDDYDIGVIGSSKATTLDDLLVPPLLFDLHVKPAGIEGQVEVLEPGARSLVRGSVRDGKLDATVDIDRLALSNRRLPRGLGGVSSLRGSVKLDDQRFEVTARGSVGQFDYAGVEVGHARFDVDARGVRAHPQNADLKLNVTAKQVALGQLRFDDAKVEATGNRGGARVSGVFEGSDGRRVTAKGRVQANGVVTDAQLTIDKPGLAISSEVRRFDWNRRHFDVPRLSIKGTKGQLEARLLYQPGVAEGAISARTLQLRRVVSELGLPPLPVRATISLDTEFSIGSDLQRGQLHGAIEDLAVQDWGNSDVSLSARIDGQAFSGTLEGTDELGFGIKGNWDTQLSGHALDPASYRGITGTGQVALFGIPLGPLTYLVPDELIKGIEGKLGVKALVQRTGTEGYPNAFVEVGCSVDRAQLHWDGSDYDLQTIGTYLSLAFDAQQRGLSATGTLSDEHGLLLTAQANTRFDPDDWLHSSVRGLERLRKAPLFAQFNVPERALSQLPVVKLPSVDGTVSARMSVNGSVDDPQLVLNADARELTPPGVRADTPVSLNVQGVLTPGDGQVNLGFNGSSRGRRLLTGIVQGTVPWYESPQSTTPLFATATFEHMPLAVLNALDELEVGGDLNGQLLLQRGDSPTLIADLELDKLSSGRAVLGKGSLRLRGTSGSVLANFATTRDDRSLTVRLSAQGATKQVPLPNQLEQIDVGLSAQGLDAGALGPALESIVARLGGRLDANLTLSAIRHTSTKPGVPHSWTTHLDGEARLRDGIGYIEGVGMELRSVELTLRAAEKGDGSVLTIDPLQAKVRSKTVNLEGQAELVLDGLKLSHGTAALRLRSVPLTLQGHNLGKARGQALARLERRPEWDVRDRWFNKPYLYVGVDLKDWQVTAAPSASRELIDPSPNPDVVIVQSKADETSDTDTMPYRIVIRLDHRASFSLSDLQVPLSGTVIVDYTDTASMRGTIDLKRGGRIPIFGRVFRVVDGRLQLNPKDPSNPLIDITLSGRTSADEPVVVTIAGTLQDPTTQPSPAELQAILGGGAASVLGSGVQALGVNQLLGSSVQVNVSSTTEDENDASYGASVQLDENLWFEANYERNQDATINQETTSIVSGTLDYRFRNNWSLRTKVGNTGGSVDVLWEYRY